MREIKRKSALPVYIAAAVFAVYALAFPLYALWHFLIAACVTAAVWLLADRLFKPVVEYVPEPAPEPVSYGERADAILRTDAAIRAQLERLRSAIRDDAVRERIAQLSQLGGKIAQQATREGADLARIEKFQGYYPPTTIKLLNAYDRMDALGVEGENLTRTKKKIEAMLDTELEAYAKQLDSLFAGEALDIDAEIEVMGRMLRREGLSDEDELSEYLRQAEAAQHTKTNNPTI